MPFKLNLSEIFKWIDLERLIYSFAITFISITAMNYLCKDFYTFLFTIEYFEPITPLFQWIGLTCISYTILTFLSYVWSIICKIFYKFKDKNENGRTWKSS